MPSAIHDDTQPPMPGNIPGMDPGAKIISASMGAHVLTDESSVFNPCINTIYNKCMSLNENTPPTL